MSNTKYNGFGTRAVHAGVEPEATTGAVMTPIFQTSTYAQAAPGDHKGYEYSRTQNPTRQALENSIAALEHAQHGLVFGSGMAAIDAVIKLFKPGDEIISTNDLYGGTYRIFTKIFENYGLHFRFVDMTKLENVEEAISERTKLIWVETPTNPTLKIIDIRGIAELTENNEILLAVDNTFASPYLQNPLNLGADLVMHSVTKYIGGHSDVVMGALALNDDDLAERLAFIQNSCGAVSGPMDCFLVLRGIKTLHLRMKQHSKSGKTIAKYLNKHPKVSKVYYPGLKDHPGYEVAQRQMKDSGGMLSFELKNGSHEEALVLLKNLDLFTLAESLGGVESLIGHPASMTHASIPKAEREEAGVTDGLLRLSVGIEDIEDLMADLEQALAKL